MKCTIVIGEETKGTFDDEYRFRGSLRRTGLKLDSIKIAHEIMKLAKVQCYMIMELNEEYEDFSFSDEPLFQTQNIRDYYNKQNEAAVQYDLMQKRKCEVINSWPRRNPIENGIDNLEVFYVRKTDYTYDRRMSRSIQGYYDFEFLYYGKPVMKSFFLENYITRNGAYLIKKFKEDWNVALDFTDDFDCKNFLMKLHAFKIDLKRKMQAIS